MARRKRSEKDESRGERFCEICERLFPGQPRAYIAEMLGNVSGGSIRNWEMGQSIAPDALLILERMGVSLDYLMRGEGEPMLPVDNIPAPQPTPAQPEMEDQRYTARAIGANLKYLRQQRYSGWGGQKKFADFLGINPNDLCVYEYGRSVPNEERLTQIADRLGITAEQLLHPLPGVTVPPAISSDTVVMPAGDKMVRERLDELRRQVARLEGRIEAAQDQIASLRSENQSLRDVNYGLRHLLFSDDSPDGKARREQMLESLEPSIAEQIRQLFR